jgi:phospholipase C
MQNRSFDHLFGTFPGANGIHAGVPGYSQVGGAAQGGIEVIVGQRELLRITPALSMPGTLLS